MSALANNCTQLAPNGYTCLDGNFRPDLALAGIFILLAAILLGYVAARSTQNSVNTDEEKYDQKRYKHKKNSLIAAAAEVGFQRSNRDYSTIDHKIKEDAKTIEQAPGFRADYLDDFTWDERMWFDAFKWIKWRWVFDGLMFFGTLLIIAKLVEFRGPLSNVREWHWGIILTPYFLLDCIVLYGIWMHSKFCRVFFSEKFFLGLYTILLGFPMGTILKILVVIQLETSTNINKNWFYILPLVSISFALVSVVMWACLGKKFGSYQIVFAMFITIFLAYFSLALVSMLRIIWPSEARRHMNEKDYDYRNSIFFLVPATNVLEAAIVIFMGLGCCLLVAYIDFMLAWGHPKGPFEKSRKFGNVVLTTSITIFIACALYLFDEKNRGGFMATRNIWLAYPLLIGNGIVLLHLLISTIKLNCNSPPLRSSKGIYPDMKHLDMFPTFGRDMQTNHFWPDKEPSDSQLYNVPKPFRAQDHELLDPPAPRGPHLPKISVTSFSSQSEGTEMHLPDKDYE
eukprot:m.230476 g.230476  ORF g.230476 m.230476 type:complete len:512 (-) comp16000_c0_seq5:3716-5251(-)